MEILVHRQGKNYGPYPIETVEQYLASGSLSRSDMAWCEGMSEWIPLAQILQRQPPAPSGYSTNITAQPSYAQHTSNQSSVARSSTPSSGTLRRWLLFFGVNIAICFTIGIIVSILGIATGMNGGLLGGSVVGLFIFSLIVGFAGALISLGISKWMAIWIYGVKVIKTPQNELESWLVDTVTNQAQMARLPTVPAMGIYESTEVNAFATGPTKSHSIVAVSSELLNQCNPDEVEAIIAHEVGHIAAGDMVTMTLLQGILNTFVIFFSRLIGFAVKNASGDKVGHWVSYIVMFLSQIILGILASLILMAYSRRREFFADAFSAKLCGAQPMINALLRLDSLTLENFPADERGTSMATFKISASSKNWLDLFSTHPPISARIEALNTTHKL